MGQNFFSVFKPLLHFGIIVIESNCDADTLDLLLFVSVGNHLGLGTEFDLGLVLEIYLNQLVAESKHDGVSCLHPLLQVHEVA